MNEYRLKYKENVKEETFILGTLFIVQWLVKVINQHLLTVIFFNLFQKEKKTFGQIPSLITTRRH